MWYAYVRNMDFSRYWLLKDPNRASSSQEVLTTFLWEVGTCALLTAADLERIPECYRNEMFYSYVAIPPGAAVNYCLTLEGYYKRLDRYIRMEGGSGARAIPT